MSQQPGGGYGAAGEGFGQGQQVGGQGQQYGQGGGRMGQQGTGEAGQPGGQQGPVDLKLDEGLTEEMRVVLHDLVQSATACEWCAERCIDEGPGMAECIRLCRDVGDLATLNVQFISRDSVFGPEAIEVFASAAEACAQECARHGHRHCQECAEVLSRAVQSTRKMLASFGGGEGIQAPGQSAQVGQFQQGGPGMGGGFQQSQAQPQQQPWSQGGQGQGYQQPGGGQGFQGQSAQQEPRTGGPY